MFARMKQKVREKTGRAVATAMPEDLQPQITYVEAWEGRDKKIVKIFNDITCNWKKNKHRTDIMKAAEDVAEDCDNELKAGAKDLMNFLKLRIDKEKKSYDITQNFDKSMKTFFNAELKTIIESIKVVKKRRLTRDAAEADLNAKQNDERQRKFETAENEFQAAIKNLREKMLKIPELDQMHADTITMVMETFAETYNDG